MVLDYFHYCKILRTEGSAKIKVLKHSQSEFLPNYPIPQVEATKFIILQCKCDQSQAKPHFRNSENSKVLCQVSKEMDYYTLMPHYKEKKI